MSDRVTAAAPCPAAATRELPEDGEDDDEDDAKRSRRRRGVDAVVVADVLVVVVVVAAEKIALLDVAVTGGRSVAHAASDVDAVARMRDAACRSMTSVETSSSHEFFFDSR